MSEPTGPDLVGSSEASGIERRVWTRYSANLSSSCRIKALLPSQTVRARVRNISVGGISLIVATTVEPGTVIPVELQSTLRKFTRTLELRVLYCVEHPGGDSILGGEFLQPLGEEELKHFLSWQQPPRAAKGRIKLPPKRPAETEGPP